jgi:hypothetical protein
MASAGLPHYSQTMKNTKQFKQFIKTSKIGFVLGAVLLAVVTENAANAGGLSVGIAITPPVVIVPPPVVVAPPVVVVQDDYVYYPDYAIYYNTSRHQYAYLNGGAWVFAAMPYGVSAEVLFASPSVHMDFHDSPEHHHAEMVHRYPGNRKSGESDHGHDDHGQDHGHDKN